LARLLRRPPVLLAAALLSILLLVRPWGDFPLNDDWQYARVVKHLADGWRFKIDVAIAPALVLQAYLAAGLAWLFGFSHLLLRLLTLVAATALLWVVDRILATVGARKSDRVLAGGLLMVNPIFLYLACSFMTEIYGYLLALLAVLLWLSRRQRDHDRSGRPMTSYATGVGVALLAGASFWIRQFCLTVYPALVAAGLLDQLRRRDSTGLRKSLPRLLTSAVVLMVVVGGYFAWARWTGNYRKEFSNRLGDLHRIQTKLWQLSAFEMTVYLTAFFFPFLFVAHYRRLRWQWLMITAGAIMLLVWRGKHLQDQFAGFHHHVAFPYSANLINNPGVGPMTLSSAYSTRTGAPRWSAEIWETIESGLLGLVFTWSLWWAVPRRRDILAGTLRCFALGFGLLSAALAVQAYDNEVLDRYYFPVVLAAALFLGSAHQGEAFSKRRDWGGRVLAGIAALPLAWFTIAGMHDYFRWNEARWELARHALKLVEASNLDGGFEVNGWLNYDNFWSMHTPQGCIGRCRCNAKSFICTDDSYQLSLQTPADHTMVAERSPSFWLLPRTTLILSKRRE
jgi:hypothetical protein